MSLIFVFNFHESFLFRFEAPCFLLVYLFNTKINYRDENFMKIENYFYSPLKFKL